MSYWFEEYSGGESEAAAYQAANPAPQDTPEITPEMYTLGAYEGQYGIDTTYGEILTTSGTANSPPLESTPPQSSGNTSFSGVQNLMGSIGGVLRSFTGLVRDAGTAVGTVQRTVNEAPATYERARSNAESGNKLGQWWQYSSTTDKLTVGIGLAGLYFLLRKG